jgi:hypothetical protein
MLLLPVIGILLLVCHLSIRHRMEKGDRV